MPLPRPRLNEGEQLYAVQSRVKAETLDMIKQVAIAGDLTRSQVIRGILEGWAIGKIRKLRPLTDRRREAKSPPLRGT